MTTIPELPELAAATDDDLLVIFDVGLEVGYKISKAAFLDGIARLQQPAEFTTLSADSASFTEITAALLSFAAGGAIADAATAQENITVPALAAGASGQVTVAVPGLSTGMAVRAALIGEPPAGILLTAWASATGTATIRFTNVGTGGTSATGMLVLQGACFEDLRHVALHLLLVPAEQRVHRVHVALDEDLAVADASGAGNFDDFPGDVLGPQIIDPDRDLHLRQKRKRILGIGVSIEVAFLLPHAFHFHHAQRFERSPP